MIAGLFSLARPFLQALDPETAHHLTIRSLALLPPVSPPSDDPRLSVRALGQLIPNPVGLAAGFDKQCEVPDALLGLGFGFGRHHFFRGGGFRGGSFHGGGFRGGGFRGGGFRGGGGHRR